MTGKNQITHESETQRQFVRLQLPAMAEIDGTRFTVKDLSSGGMSLRGTSKALQKGKMIDLTLIIPFEDFTLDIALKAEIQHTDKKNDLNGCRFIDLTANQISILNHIITSFMAGDMVGASDIVHIASRENFVNVRNHKEDHPLTLSEQIKKYSAYAVITLLTLGLSLFIINNFIQKLLIVKTPYGYVHAENVTILNPTPGIFEPALPEGIVSIKKGQTLGYIRPPENNNSSATIAVTSPCECFISETFVLNEEYRPQDSKLFTLLPRKNNLSIMAIISIDDAHRIKIGARADITLIGSRETIKGKVSNISSNKESPTQETKPTATVTITPNQTLSQDQIDKPARVEFHL